MTVQEFMTKDDYTIIQFAFELLKDVQNQVQLKHMFYKNQVVRYIDKQIQLFMNSLAIKPALKVVYIRQIHSLIDHRISNLFQRENLLQIV
ncbi:hypothetical protein LC040_07830 [Bacillus tianshenii]|nr:hypothetical protein LC040_07830 [Bacillus tianshenii]